MKMTKKTVVTIELDYDHFKIIAGVIRGAAHTSAEIAETCGDEDGSARILNDFVDAFNVLTKNG